MLSGRTLALSCLLLSGCGGGLVPVKGKVTLDGKPLDAATIMFVPANEGQGRDARGLTDDQGNFSLSTFKKNDGAFPGEYKVLVTKTPFIERPPGMRGPEDAAKPPSARAMAEAAARSRQLQRENPIPAIYRNAKITPLVLQIPKGGDKNVELNIDSKLAAQKK